MGSAASSIEQPAATVSTAATDRAEQPCHQPTSEQQTVQSTNTSNKSPHRKRRRHQRDDNDQGSHPTTVGSRNLGSGGKRPRTASGASRTSGAPNESSSVQTNAPTGTQTSWLSLLKVFNRHIWEEAVYSCIPEKQAPQILGRTRPSPQPIETDSGEQESDGESQSILVEEEDTGSNSESVHLEDHVIADDKAETETRQQTIPIQTIEEPSQATNPPKPPPPPVEESAETCPFCRSTRINRHAKDCPIKTLRLVRGRPWRRTRHSSKVRFQKKPRPQTVDMSYRALSQIMEGLLATNATSIENPIAPRPIMTLAQYLYTQCSSKRLLKPSTQRKESDANSISQASSDSETLQKPQPDMDESKDETSEGQDGTSSSEDESSNESEDDSTAQQHAISWNWNMENGFPFQTGAFICPSPSARECDDGEDEPMDPDYAVIAGSTIWVLEWSVLARSAEKGTQIDSLVCRTCATGQLECDGLDGLIPLFGDTPSKLSWIVSIQYKCNHCEQRVCGTCPRFLSSLPKHLRKLYPSFLSWVQPSGRFQVTRGLARKIEATIESKPQCGAQQIHYDLQTQYDALYAMEEMEFTLRQQNVDDCGFMSDSEMEAFPSFRQWLGQVKLPTPKEIEELHRYAIR